MEDSVKSIINNANIDPDTEVDVYIDDKVFIIEMSGFYVKRLQAMGDWFLSLESTEKILKAYNTISENPNGPINDLLTFNIQTYLMLMQTVDKAAKEQGATKKMKYKDLTASVQNATELVPDEDTGLDSTT